MLKEMAFCWTQQPRVHPPKISCKVVSHVAAGREGAAPAPPPLHAMFTFPFKNTGCQCEKNFASKKGAKYPKHQQERFSNRFQKLAGLGYV